MKGVRKPIILQNTDENYMKIKEFGPKGRRASLVLTPLYPLLSKI